MSVPLALRDINAASTWLNHRRSGVKFPAVPAMADVSKCVPVKSPASPFRCKRSAVQSRIDQIAEEHQGFTAKFETLMHNLRNELSVSRQAGTSTGMSAPRDPTARSSSSGHSVAAQLSVLAVQSPTACASFFVSGYPYVFPLEGRQLVEFMERSVPLGSRPPALPF